MPVLDSTPPLRGSAAVDNKVSSIGQVNAYFTYLTPFFSILYILLKVV